jgi:hypothetical protein
MKTIRTALAVGTVLFLVAATCQIDKPASDATPPRIEWRVHNSSTNVAVIITDTTKPFLAKPGENYNIMMKVIDEDGGVQRITLDEQKKWECVANEIILPSKTVDPDPVTNILSASNGKVETTAILLSDADFDIPCDASGFTAHGSQVFEGSGANHFGGETKSTLIMQF